MAHEDDLALAVVEFADALVSDFDVVDLLHVFTSRCVELLGVHAAVLMLPDERGQLRVMAGSSGQAHLLALFELKTGEGPSLGCYRAGRPVSATNLGRPDPRWPRFSERARRDGFASMHALPLRQHEDIIGVLGLFSTAARPISDGDARIVQALAKLATVTVLRQRTIQELQGVAEQLQNALSSRVLIEQAKGVVAERFKINMSMAFDTLRNHARRTNLRLSDLAQCVIDGAVEADQLAPPLAAAAKRPQNTRDQEMRQAAEMDGERWKREPAAARPVPLQRTHRRDRHHDVRDPHSRATGAEGSLPTAAGIYQ